MIEIIGGTWAAGELKTFHINGEYLEVLDAQYPIDIMLMDKVGAQLSIMSNSEASFFSRPKEGFSTVQIRSSQAQLIRIFVGSGDAGTRRISSTVQVVDGNKARSTAGGSFGWRPTSQATGTNYAASQLWNPAGSGVRSVIDGFTLTANAGTDVSWGFNTVQLATPGQALVNLLSASPAVAQTLGRIYNGVTPPTFTGFGASFLQANSQVTIKLARPVVLLPGNGFVISAGLGGAYFISGQVELFEELL